MRPLLAVASTLSVCVFHVAAQPYVITTVAGGGLPRTPARALDVPVAAGTLAVASDGSVYFSALNCVFRIDNTGMLTRVAGTSQEQGYSGDGGPATGAMLNGPGGLALDALGNLYIADSANNRVRRVSVDGVITTIAGDGTRGYAGDGGPAAAAKLSGPVGLALDSAGNLFMADSGNRMVRKVTRDGIISTVAGSLLPVNQFGIRGDGGPATSAILASPGGVAVDSRGNLYIADYGDYRVRKVGVDGVIATFAGTGTAGFSGDGGPAVAARISTPAGLDVDQTGTVYFADAANHRIRAVAPEGTISTIAGNGSQGYSGDQGPATDVRLNAPLSVAIDTQGDVIVADTANKLIRKVAVSDGSIATIAGNVIGGDIGDHGAGPDATLFSPRGVFAGSDGLLLITDTGNNRIRKLTPDGIITTIAGNGNYDYSGDGGPAELAGLRRPWAGAVDVGGNIFLTDSQNHVIRRVDTEGKIETVAGNGTAGYSGDGGPATSAQLNSPSGLAVDPDGSIYIADSNNNRIRKVTKDGTITTVAGDGTKPFSDRVPVGDGGPAGAAQLNNPQAVAVDTAGNLFIADSRSFRIRKVTVDGIISTVAGNGLAGGNIGLGGPAIQVSIASPQGVTVDAAGNLYVSAFIYVHKVLVDGTITTIAGGGGAVGNATGYSGDGGPATNAMLTSPVGLAVDGSGNVYIADSGSNVVRMLTPTQ